MNGNGEGNVKVFDQTFFKKFAEREVLVPGGHRPAPTEPAGETGVSRP